MNEQETTSVMPQKAEELDAAIEELKRVAKSGSDGEFVFQLFSVAEMDMSSATNVLIGLLSDETIEPGRIPMAFSLIDCQDSEVFDYLDNELSSDNEERRFAAIIAVGNLTRTGMGIVIDLHAIAGNESEPTPIRAAAISSLRKVLTRMHIKDQPGTDQ